MWSNEGKRSWLPLVFEICHNTTTHRLEVLFTRPKSPALA